MRNMARMHAFIDCRKPVSRKGLFLRDGKGGKAHSLPLHGGEGFRAVLMKKGIVLYLIFFLMTSSVSADDAVLGGKGNTVYPIYDTQVEMLSEQVDIEVKGDKSFIRCEFLFRNTGEKERVMAGFPAYGTLPPSEEREAFGDDIKIYDFKTYVDGKEVKVGLKKGLKEEGNNKEGMYYANWYVWEMTFEKAQVRRVVNTYWVKNGYDSIGGKMIEYVLETGSTWKNSIGYGKITMHFDREVDPQDFVIRDYDLYQDNPNILLRIMPEDRKFVWEFFALEPNFNIRLYDEDSLARRRYLLFDPWMDDGSKDMNAIRKYGSIAYEAYRKGNYDQALDAMGRVNRYKEHRDKQVSDYALETANFLDYYRGLILMERGDYKGAIYYFKTSGLLENRNLYPLSQLYKKMGDTDQYIHLLNKIAKENISRQGALELWAAQELKDLPAGIKVKYGIGENIFIKRASEQENKDAVVKGRLTGQENSSYKGFIVFNIGVLILIFVIYWNIKKR